MLKYLTIPLSAHSISYCHYPSMSSSRDNAFIDGQTLSDILIWSMKENLSVQFLYPYEALPDSLKALTESVDNIKIAPVAAEDSALSEMVDILVSDSFSIPSIHSDKIYIVRSSLGDFLGSEAKLLKIIRTAKRLNVVFTDIPNLTEKDLEAYHHMMQKLAITLAQYILDGKEIQFNLLTDRIMLTSMNNCNAGHESIVVSETGDFYPCPAFIGNSRFICGNIKTGFKAPDGALYDRENAPICRICDAYQCKRCVWLNHLFTHEVNTPSWQQCKIAHIERSAAKTLLETIRTAKPEYLSGIDIPGIDYTDPFEKLEK